MVLSNCNTWALIGLSLGFLACSASSEDDDGNTAGGGTTSAGGAGAANAGAGGATAGTSGSAGLTAGGAGGAAAGAGGSSCTPLAPTGTAELIMSEIVPGMGIEVFNPGTTAVPVSDIWFCSQFDYQKVPATSAKTEVPPGGYLALNWPASAGYTLATEAGGEMLMFFSNDGFPTEDNALDYVCWGAHTGGRKDDETVGTDVLYTGDCAPALTAGAIHRRPATSGSDAASYDTAAAPSLADCPL